MLTDEPAVGAQAELYEALVADDDTLQAQQLALIEGSASRLADGAAPALNAVLWRPFAFDDVARL